MPERQVLTVEPQSASENHVGAVMVRARVRWIVAWILLGSILLQEIIAVRGVSYMTADAWPVLLYDGVIILWIWRQHHAKRLSLGALAGPPPRDARRLPLVLAGPFFAVASIGAQLLIAMLARNLIPPMESNTKVITNELLPWGSVTRMGVAILMLTVVAPIVEETLYRGILLNRWIRRFGVRSATALSVALFALVHERVVWAACFGLLLTFLYLRTASLWISMGVHCLNNLTSLFWMVFTHREGDAYHLSLRTQTTPWLALALTGFGLVGLLFVLRRSSEAGHPTVAT